MPRSDLPTEIWIILYTEVRLGGIVTPRRLVTTDEEEAHEALHTTARRSVRDVEIFKITPRQRDWQAFRWVPPTIGRVEEESP